MKTILAEVLAAVFFTLCVCMVLVMGAVVTCN